MEPSVSESFETSEMRTTHHLQQIDFTTENATSSRITTSVTATNSTRISTSSRAPPRSAPTTIFTGRTITQVPFTFVHQPTPKNPASIKPTFSTTIIPATTSVHIIFKTTTLRTSFTNKIAPKSSKTPVHIIAGNKYTKTSTPPTYAHRSTSSYFVSLQKSTQFSAILTTYTNPTNSPVTSTSRIPLTPLFTSVVARKTTTPLL